MKFLHAVKGCTRLIHIRNEKIREELGIRPILTQIRQYKEKWGEHLQRMEKYRLPRTAWEYQPTGRRNPGRPRMWWTIEPEQAMGPRP
jgi:hypothetical protein